MTNKNYIYVNITEKSILLILIADLLKLDKYMLFLLYETFGNDIFLVFDMFYRANLLLELTEFRLKRFYRHAEVLYPILIGKDGIKLSTTLKRSLQIVYPLLYENKFRIEAKSYDSKR